MERSVPVGMLKGKQRSYLKGLAHELEPAVYIGKAGLTDSIVKNINENLKVHELVKVSIGKDLAMDPKEVCNEVAEMLGAHFVQAIGRKFVLYRRAADPEYRKIQLPR